MIEFTRRQKQLIRLIASGHSRQEIALALGITIRTVYDYVEKLNAEIGTKSDFDLAIWCYLTVHNFHGSRFVPVTRSVDAGPGMAWCTSCEGYVRRELFYKNRHSGSGLDNLCKMHRELAKRRWRLKMLADPERAVSAQTYQTLWYTDKKRYEASMRYGQFSTG